MQTVHCPLKTPSRDILVAFSTPRLTNFTCDSRRRHHRVVVEDRSVAPVWLRLMAARHRSAGGRWWSWRSWSIQRLRGRPEMRTQSRSGRLPTDASTYSLSAWWAGMLGDILATCPKMASRRLLMLFITCDTGSCLTECFILYMCNKLSNIHL